MSSLKIDNLESISLPMSSEPSTHIHDFKLFKQYLADSKRRFTAESYDKISFVIGNEAMDLDSLVSSLAYAYLLQQKEASKSHLTLPVLNLPKADLASRKHLIYLLKQLSIPTDHLLFWDELEAMQLPPVERYYHLVDHNRLAFQQSHLSPNVKSIVDHHHDSHDNYPKLEHKVIKTVGSCATLIWELFNKSKITLTGEGWVKLFLAAIYIDTSRLKNSSKTTQSDIYASDALLSIFSDIEGLYEGLHKAQQDLTGLSFKQILYRDLKKYKDPKLRYSISSIPISWDMQKLLKEPNNLKTLQELCSAKELDACFVLSKNSSQRELFIFAPNAAKLNRLISKLSDNSSLKSYGLSAATRISDNSYSFKLNSSAARKYIQPLFNFC
ncbi:MAG: hypothetical protein GWP59_06010 [Chlamydiales bacterium]|nr:DHH family phosphoesterase [Chlamydiales bacterium]NCF71236.1 hypothetical protein [Chlamydiales bacterium]